MNFNDQELYMIIEGSYRYSNGCAGWVKDRKSLIFYIAKELVDQSPYKLDIYLRFIKDLDFDISIKIEEEKIPESETERSSIKSPSNQYFKITLKTGGYSKNVYYTYTIFRRLHYFMDSFKEVLRRYIDYENFAKLDKVDKFNLVSSWDLAYTSNLLTNGYYCYQSFTNYDQQIFNKTQPLDISKLTFKMSEHIQKALKLSKDMDIKIFRDLLASNLIRVYGTELHSDTVMITVKDKRYLSTMRFDLYRESFAFNTDFYIAIIDYSSSRNGITLLWYVKDGVVIKEGEVGYKKASIKRRIRSLSNCRKYTIYHQDAVFPATWEYVLQIKKNSFICVD